MAKLADVRRIALSLPEVAEQTDRDGLLSWRVRNKLMVWERPLRRADLAALGAAAPAGTIICLRVPDPGAKAALIADEPDIFFTTPHFDGYPMVLIQLERISAGDLTELIVEAWLERAPKRLAREYLAAQAE